jgi:hypothetical protein
MWFCTRCVHHDHLEPSMQKKSRVELSAKRANVRSLAEQPQTPVVKSAPVELDDAQLKQVSGGSPNGTWAKMACSPNGTW